MKVAVLRTRASVHDMTSLLSISGLESQKVSYGLRISRLSKDLYELLTELDLNDVALPGHSMGNLFSQSRLRHSCRIMFGLITSEVATVAGFEWTGLRNVYFEIALLCLAMVHDQSSFI
jgi:hypothetical protein